MRSVGRAALSRVDMRTAGILGLAGTPAYLIGRRLPGGDKVEILDTIHGLPPYEDLEKRLNDFLAAGPGK